MNTLYKKSSILFTFIIILSLGNYTYSQEAIRSKVPLKKEAKTTSETFQLRTEFAIKGNMTFIANNTLNRSGKGGSTAANNDFNRRGSNSDNGNMNMDYIDVDNDPSTFSSSSATLNLPGCSKVTYAGLYWAAIYPYQDWNDQEVDGEATPPTRDNDFNLIKFKLPGASDYVDITGDVLYDSGASNEKPYVCYKEVTGLLQGLSDPNGIYYGANIKATKGKDIHGDVLGSSAGWVLVVIYENAGETRKKFFVYDGFSTIKEQAGGAAGVYDIPLSGFTTIPVGQVGANFLLGALEGDINIGDDTFQIEDTSGNFQTLSTANINDANNFFNSTISINDTFLEGRNPSSENTLGFEVDFFELNNPGNTLLGNDQTSSTLRFSSQGDTYWPFLLGMSVEIIEPDIELVKLVDDGFGNDIGGSDVNLGDVLWYDIRFKNRGNDDATETEIIDRLPKNVDLITSDIIVPNGVTYTYEPPTLANEYRGVLKFQIPDSMVTKGGAENHIRIKVKVVENCNELRDVCSNRIENQAVTNYKGVTSGVVVNEATSFYGLDECNFGFAGTSNFLTDVSGCTYEREETLCASSIELSAGSGFLSYEWTNEQGDVIGNSQTLTVSEVGTYTVNKTATYGCINTQEIINVVNFEIQDNPLLAFADEVKTCPNDGTKLSEIYLCGEGSTKEITTSIFNSNTILWQKLDEASCGVVSDENCANTDNACTWNTVKEGNNFTADTAGQYRLEVRSQGGCFKRFYFNVFKATLNPQIESNDIICGTPGSITINNIPNDYEFSLTNGINSFQDSNIFNIATAGSYDLYIRKKGASATSCVYTLPSIDIVEKNIEVDLITQPIACSDSYGEVRAQVKNVPGDYTYKLFKDGSLLATIGPKPENDHKFAVSEAGNYTVEVTTQDGCSFTGDVTFTKPEPLVLTAVTLKDISCTDGTIELNSYGGTPNYNYAIWSYNGVDLYNSVNDIPFSDFFFTNILSIPEGKEGTYEYLAIDSNNCWTISNPVTINLEPDIAFNETINNVVCKGESNGSFEISVDGNNLGYSLEYSINDGTTYQNSGFFNNLPVGNQTVKIKATKGSDVCFYEKVITISEPETFTGSASLTGEYTCTTPGVITFDSPTGGTAPYQFSIDGSNYFTSKVFNNLIDGTYQISVKDANNCVLNLADITIDALPVAPVFTPTVVYNCDGKGNVSITPTDPSYLYSIDGGPFSSTSTFNNVSEGNHTIDINYGKNCIETIVVIIESNKAFTGIVSNISNVICNGGSDGAITINAENFGSSFEYSLNGASWVSVSAASITLNNLTAGSYGVKIQSDSCVIDLGTHSITEPDAVSVSASITKQISCTNSGATITPTATGGTGPYLFSIDNGFSWASEFTNLSAGSYTITAKDANDCLALTNATVQIDAPSSIEYTATSTLCYDGTNGEINVSVTHGNGNYVFSINNGPWFTPDASTPTQYTFNNLTPNTYNIKVKDALGCESSVSSHTIYSQIEASISTTDINCNDGTITVNATGGDGNYSYAFVNSGSAVSASDFGNTNTKSITNVGDYDVYVRDHNGGAGYCQILKTVTIQQIPDLVITATATDPTCFGEKGKIKVDLTGGLAPFSIEVSGPSGFLDTTTSFFGATKEYFNLNPGNYTITITGANGCLEVTNTTITEPIELSATLNPIIPECGITDPAQFGFEFDVIAADYAPYSLEYSADNGATWSTNPVFMNLVSGTEVNPVIRLLETDDTVRCMKFLDTYTIPFHVTNLVVSTVPAGTCADGFKVTVEAKDGVGPYEFAMNSTTVWETPTPANSTIHTFENLIPGLTYTFYVKDALGCVKQNSVDIYDAYTPDVIITGAVTQEACPTSDNGAITFSIDDSNNPLTGTLNWILYDKEDPNTSVQSGNQGNTDDIVVSNLPAGNYYLTITNGATCSWGSSDITIKKGTEITGLVIAARDITCALPGIVDITNINGGFGNYVFTLTSPNFVAPIVTSNTSVEVPLSNLTDPTITATVSVSVKDQYQCEKLLGDVLLNVSEQPEVLSVVANSCDVNKTITVTGTKGLAPYFYSIDDGVTYQSSSLFENLAPGDYLVKITDSNGCISDSESVKIVPSLDFNATITKNLDCTVSPNAEVEINVTSGSGDYDFEIKNSSNNLIYPRAILSANPKTVSFSIADTYKITIFDNDASAINCSKTIEVTIPETILPEFTYVVEDSTCSGSNSGSISLSDSNPSISYTYSINPASGSFDVSTNSFINLSPGNYEITALGSNGCSTVKSNIVISEFDPIVIPNPTVTEFGCTTSNTNNNAVITVDVGGIIGGSGNYPKIEFTDNKGTVSTADDVVVQSGANSTYTTNDKNGGNFTITVYDDNNCTATTSAIIQPFAELISSTITIDKAIDCATGEDITVSYTSSVPITNVSYVINGDSGYTATNTTGIFTNLSEDRYTISIRNQDTNCLIETIHEVTDPNDYLLVVEKQNDVSCFGSNTGAVSLRFDPSTPYGDTYNYIVYNNATNAATTITGSGTGTTLINGLPKGEYYASVTMVDSPFCIVKSPIFKIEDPIEALDFSISETLINCSAANSGALTIIATGGWGEYFYKLETATGTLIQDYSSAAFINNLEADSYVVFVKDKNGCEISKNIIISAPTPISASVTETTSILCNGDDGASITVSAVSGGQGNPPNYWYQLQKGNETVSAKQTSPIFNGLGAGSYTVLVSDEYSCSITLPVTITEPSKVQAKASITSTISCLVGTANVEVTASGGAGNYMYSEDGINFVASNIFSVIPGNHQFFARDSDGCISEASTIVTIEDVTPLKAELNVVSSIISCASDNSAVLSANVSGGLGNYKYELLDNSNVVIRPVQTSNTFENLGAGTYKIRVTSEDCVTTTGAYTIIEPTPLVLTSSIEVTDITCFGSNNGRIKINATGGTGDLIYSINQIKFVNTNIFENLSAGDYDVIVQDQNGCFIMETVTIKEPNQLEASAININEETCSGNSDASFEIQITGGTGPYKTKLGNGAFVEGQLVFTNLDGGKTHVVFVEDSMGCETVVIVPLKSGVELSLNTVTETNCINYLGKITATVDAKYSSEVTYSLNGGVSQASGVFDNLTSGTYTLTATHVDGCIITKEVVINNPNPLTFSSPATLKKATCNGANDGEIIINAQGGQGNLLYSIDGTTFQSSNTFTALTAGTYQITVKDELGCPITESVTITQPKALDAKVINVKEETCFGENNASFELEILGGTAPYKTKLNEGVFVENQLLFNNVEGGKTHVVYVLDSMGCETQISIPLKKAVELNFNTTTEVNCSTYLSTINATVDSAYVNEVVYSLNGGTSQASGIFEGLIDGNYTLKVTHINGCEKTKEIVITNPEPLTFNAPAEVTDVLCFGADNGTIKINAKGGRGDLLCSIDGINYKRQSEFTNLAPGTYQISVKDQLNCAPITETVIIKEPTDLQVSPINIKQATCFGLSNASFELQINGDEAPYQTKLEGQTYVEGQIRFENLEGGKTYKVFVKGKNECEKIIEVPLEPTVNLNLNLSTLRSCDNNTTITATINEDYKDDVLFSINNSTPQKEPIFKNLAAGDYTVKVIHKNGCSTSKQVSVDEIDPLSLFVNSDTINKLIISSYGGEGPYTYSIDDGDFTTNNEFIISETKTYKITVRDALGCEVSEFVEGEFVTIVIPNFFTPNGNGENDYWYPEKVQEYHKIKVQIYDRYSRLLKTLYGKQRGWDGNYNNTLLPSGDYWYVIEYIEILGEKKKLIGNFTLYR